MTHTYTLTGLTCNNCVAKVKSELLKNPDITSAEVTLAPQQALISMSRHIPIAQLQSVLGNIGRYTISEDKVITEPQAAASWVATYKPIFLIFFFIAGVSFITSHKEGAIDPMAFMERFMAGFFLVFSFFKLLDLKGFAKSYAMYDLLAAKIPVYGLIYPFIELGLGIAYLTHFQPTIANTVNIVVMGFSSIGVIRSVVNKQQIRCACLGAVFNLPMSTITIIEDLLMVLMAGAMLILNS